MTVALRLQFARWIDYRGGFVGVLGGRLYHSSGERVIVLPYERPGTDAELVALLDRVEGAPLGYSMAEAIDLLRVLTGAT